MRYNTIGVNLDTVDKLILDIYNYAERASKTLEQISSVVESTKTFYLSEDANNFRAKFSNFETNFKTVNKNLISYAEDLTKLKNKYQDISYEMTQTVNNAIAKMDVSSNKW